jgi:hypothetical protein
MKQKHAERKRLSLKLQKKKELALTQREQEKLADEGK